MDEDEDDDYTVLLPYVHMITDILSTRFAVCTSMVSYGKEFSFMCLVWSIPGMIDFRENEFEIVVGGTAHKMNTKRRPPWETAL